MSGELILEIGVEEIPAGYLAKGLKDLAGLAGKHLKENRIDFSEELKAFGTPRRLILIGKGIAEGQEDLEKEVTGPPKKAAYDADGNPTKAATGFAKKNGVSVEELTIKETDRGEYLSVKQFIKGKPATEVLSDIIPQLIGELSWPKSMRWGSVGFTFVRPVHWVLALFNGEVIPFEVAGVKSGNTTKGHRFMAPEIKQVSSVQEYLEIMGNSHVVIDPEKRRSMVKEQVHGVAGSYSATIQEDKELVHTVANLVEYPFAVGGSFEELFLNLPEPVLITPMKEHQKYFPVYGNDGKLMAHFIAVNNTEPINEAIVRKGHERVLRARLADADFFFKEDRKRPLLDRLDDLKEVVYQAELGTSFEKVERFAKLAKYISDQVGDEQRDKVELAARLSKCDLVTEMVMEFTSLQGIMGEEYARMDGHPEDVCVAVREHYLPVRAGGDLPASDIGALVSVADRMDTITGCFAVGQEPTGAADPFALRRHALGIIRIIEDKGWHLSLKDLIAESFNNLRGKVDIDKEESIRRVRDFFRERYKNMMLGADYNSEIVEAVISAKFEYIDQLRFRIEQLRKFIGDEDEFEALVLTSKRISNILKKQEKTGTIDPALFKEDCEKNLWEAFEEVQGNVSGLLAERKFFDALNLAVKLRKPVDDLFDGVEILTKKSPELRDNRVALVERLESFFLELADFSKFSI